MNSSDSMLKYVVYHALTVKSERCFEILHRTTFADRYVPTILESTQITKQHINIYLTCKQKR